MSASLRRIPLQIRRALELALRQPGARPFFSGGVLVAVSGGLDSICLLDALQALPLPLPLTVAHFDHGLRGEASRADAGYVSGVAHARGLPCLGGQAEALAEAARATGESIEMAARTARYAFLARAAVAVGAGVIALAHHADDQAETVLLNLLRGTGVRGLSGMSALSPLAGRADVLLWRPLLRVPRADLEVYASERGLEFRQDASNSDAHMLRNRIRHDLLPRLESYTPGARKVLARMAENLAGEAEVVEAAGASALDDLRRAGGSFDRTAFQTLGAGLQRATLRAGLLALRGDLTDVRAGAIEEAVDALCGEAASAEVALAPDFRLQVAGGSFAFSRILRAD